MGTLAVESTGAMGDRLPSDRLPPRAPMLALQREVERGVVLSDAQAEKNVRFAVEVRDDPNSSVRDRMRACELLEAMRSRGINVAMYIDKAERPQESPVVNVAVVLNIPAPKTRGDE